MPTRKRILNLGKSSSIYASKPEKRLKIKMVDAPKDLELTRTSTGHGIDSLMKSAVLASLLLGEPASRIASQYNVPIETVYTWKKEFDITDAVRRRDRLSEQLLIFIESEIKNLVTIANETNDSEWIQRQGAAELAAYIRVKYDMIMKILESYGRANVQAEVMRKQMEDVEIHSLSGS